MLGFGISRCLSLPSPAARVEHSEEFSLAPRHTLCTDVSRRFALWPPRLPTFKVDDFRLCGGHDFRQLIKDHDIPLCLIEPDNAAFGSNLDAARQNAAVFGGLRHMLTGKQAVRPVPWCNPRDLSTD